MIKLTTDVLLEDMRQTTQVKKSTNIFITIHVLIRIMEATLVVSVHSSVIEYKAKNISFIPRTEDLLK